MIPLPNLPKIIKKENNRAIFEIEGLYPGYGITISNTFRRVLLSSLEGTAITQIKIKGASHEFSTIPGILEDAITIILNLKKIRFKSFTKEPQKITLKAKGEKKVRAGEFDVSSELEIKNPDFHIATITSKTTQLQIEAIVETGTGYQAAEQREPKKQESVGMISIDSIFTPVKKVSFRVENMRVGKRTDFDKLKIDIETDGTISPEEAFLEASEILYQHFTLFCKDNKKTIEKPLKKEKTEKKKKVIIKKKKVIKKEVKKVKNEKKNKNKKIIKD
jgi:DNA-directed RNA polymerase subunit alpha